jgi:hypothetical protein
MALFENIRQRYRSFRRFNHILRIFVRYGYEDVVSYLIETRRFSLLRKLIPRALSFLAWILIIDLKCLVISWNKTALRE